MKKILLPADGWRPPSPVASRFLPDDPHAASLGSAKSGCLWAKTCTIAAPHQYHTREKYERKACSEMFGNKLDPHYLTAEVAKTCPLEPTERTTTEATTTIKSAVKIEKRIGWKCNQWQQNSHYHDIIMQALGKCLWVEHTRQWTQWMCSHQW